MGLVSWSPWIFTNSRDFEFEESDNAMEFDGVDLIDLYNIIKRKTYNSKKKWTIFITNAEIYFTTRREEISKVIKYVHIVNHIQLIMVSNANFHRVKPVDCFFYPKIIFKPDATNEVLCGLNNLIHQLFEPIGIDPNDLTMLSVFWQKVIDDYHLNYADLLKIPNLMNISRLLIERQLSPRDAIQNFDEPIYDKIQIKLPKYQRYLACAVFIGCFIPEDNDKHLFVSDNRSSRSKRRKMTTNRLQLGPLPCTVIRIIAVFKMLLDQATINVNVLQMLWEMKERELISIDDVNVLCQFTYQYALECAKSVDLRLSNYFEF